MEDKGQKVKHIGRSMVVYMGGAWVCVESISFAITKYNLDQELIDIVIILVLFGLPSVLAYNLFTRHLSWKHILVQSVIVILAISSVVHYIFNPLFFDPGKLRLVKLSSEKKQIAESLSSIAVLPIANYLGDDSKEYLLAGMHDGLITEIGQLGSIRIVSRTSTLPYINSTKSVKKIAEELGVDAIVESSVTLIDTLIQLNLKLFNTVPNEELLWSHSYETTVNNIPNLYKEVTKNVALKINNVLLPGELELLAATRPVKPGAYEALLQGMYHMSFLTPEGFENAQIYLEKAIKIDPEYGFGYSGLSALWASLKQMGYKSTDEANPIINEYLAKAHELDSLSAEYLSMKALHSTWTYFRWEEADIAFRQSIEKNPNQAQTRAMYAHYLMIMNEWDKAWEQMDYAYELDPINPWIIGFKALMYFSEGKMLSAGKYSEMLTQTAPNHPLANSILLGKYTALNNGDLAIIELKKSIDKPGTQDLKAFIDDSNKKVGLKATIRLVAEKLEEKRETMFVSPGRIFFLYQLLEDQDQMIYWMTKMHEERDPNLPYSAIRNNSPIQKDPRYISIMEDIGLW